MGSQSTCSSIHGSIRLRPHLVQTDNNQPHVRFAYEHDQTKDSPSSARAEVLRDEHQILDYGLVLDVGFMLDRAPKPALVLNHVSAILGSAGHLDVVRHRQRAGAQSALAQDQLQVRQIGVLVVVQEDQVDRAGGKAMLSTQRVDGLTAVAERA